MKLWLEKNGIEMYTNHYEGKSVIAERSIRTLENKIYKYMTSVSKNVYIDKLNDIANKCNDSYHKTIKMKPVDVKKNRYIDFNKEINYKNPKFNFADFVRLSKYKNIFSKWYTPNRLKEILQLKKLKMLRCGHILLLILKENKLLKCLIKNNYKKQIKKNLEMKM